MSGTVKKDFQQLVKGNKGSFMAKYTVQFPSIQFHDAGDELFRLNDILNAVKRGKASGQISLERFAELKEKVAEIETYIYKGNITFDQASVSRMTEVNDGAQIDKFVCGVRDHIMDTENVYIVFKQQ